MTDIVTAITKKLTGEFDCPIYSDEVRENFKKPCFFIAFSIVVTPQTVNFCEKEVTVTLTYFPKDDMRDEIHYLDVFDRIHMLFPIGLKAGERFIHINDISEDRVGEDQDILQITLVFNYLETTGHDAGEGQAELMGDLSLRVVNKESRKEDTIWQN